MEICRCEEKGLLDFSKVSFVREVERSFALTAS